MNKKAIALTTILTLVGVVVLSMPGPGGGGPPGPPGGGGPPCWHPPCIPIDGGVGVLIAMGAALGVRKLYNGIK